MLHFLFVLVFVIVIDPFFPRERGSPPTAERAPDGDLRSGRWRGRETGHNKYRETGHNGTEC